MSDEPDLDLGRLDDLLAAAIASAAHDDPFKPITSAEILEDFRRVIDEMEAHPRPVWVVPPGVTVDWSLPVDVVESPLASDYVYVLPPLDDPW